MYNLSYYFKEGMRSALTNRMMTVASIGVITACLLLMGTFSVLAFNVNKVLKSVESQNEIVAFIKSDYTSEQEAALKEKLILVDNVKEAIFVSKEEALNNFKNDLGEDKDLLEGLDGVNPLRSRYRITMNDINKTSETAKLLEKVEGIEKVTARVDVSSQLIKIRNVASIIFVALIILLLFVSVFIIANTVNLTIFNRKDDIGIMKMVGATNGFIRMPFMIEGMVLGLISVAVSLLIQWSIYKYMVMAISKNFKMVEMVSFGSMFNWLLLIFAFTGIGVGLIGSIITIRKYLKV